MINEIILPFILLFGNLTDGSIITHSVREEFTFKNSFNTFISQEDSNDTYFIENEFEMRGEIDYSYKNGEIRTFYIYDISVNSEVYYNSRYEDAPGFFEYAWIVRNNFIIDTFIEDRLIWENMYLTCTTDNYRDFYIMFELNNDQFYGDNFVVQQATFDENTYFSDKIYFDFDYLYFDILPQRGVLWDAKINDYAFGYGDGYNDGLEFGLNMDSSMYTVFNGIINIALIPINFFLSIFNFEIFGINISGLITGIMTLAIVFIIAKTFVGLGGSSGGAK